jgi:hypothetical protein
MHKEHCRRRMAIKGGMLATSPWASIENHIKTYGMGYKVIGCTGGNPVIG